MDCFVTAVPCVDVIIPVFNGRETIQAALASVLTQQGPYLNKVIVIDDGSTDGTAEVVRRLGSSNVMVITTTNQGVAAARNLGISKSTAEWIAFLDADDLWMPCKLQAQLEAASMYDAGFVCCSASSKSVMASGPISQKRLAYGNCVVTSSVLVRREILENMRIPFTPGMSFAEDYLCWLKCATLTRAYYISTKFVDYTLSERPRYRWGQILRNIVNLNTRYSGFLRQIGATPIQRIPLSGALFFGSLRSVFGIIKRFANSPREGT
jgi:glycosyltransferase involved in cell wall biosynthesis